MRAGGDDSEMNEKRGGKGDLGFQFWEIGEGGGGIRVYYTKLLVFIKKFCSSRVTCILI